MKIKTRISIFGGVAQVRTNFFVVLEACKMKGTPSPIYRKGAWMVWWEGSGSLLQNDVELEACSRLDLGGHVWLCSDLACTSYHFALVLSLD